MEAILELVFWVLWSIVEIFGELLLQGFGEAVFEGIEALFRRTNRAQPPFWLSALLHAAFGAFAGWISLLIFPTLALPSPALQIANLILSPLVMGGIVAWTRGALRPTSDPDDWSHDFANAALLAFAMSLTRLVGAH